MSADIFARGVSKFIVVYLFTTNILKRAILAILVQVSDWVKSRNTRPHSKVCGRYLTPEKGRSEKSIDLSNAYVRNGLPGGGVGGGVEARGAGEGGEGHHSFYQYEKPVSSSL